MPQVRAIALKKLEEQGESLEGMVASADESDAAHYSHLAGAIERLLKDPTTAPSLPSIPNAPPGAPIGSWPMDYLEGSWWLLDLNHGSVSDPWMDALELSPYRDPGE